MFLHLFLADGDNPFSHLTEKLHPVASPSSTWNGIYYDI